MKSFDKKENKDINMIDRACKKASEVVDQKPLGAEKKKRIWENIANKLSEIDKRIMAWFLVMATSFSLLVAGGINLLIEETPEAMEIEPAIAHMEFETPALHKEVAVLDEVKPKALTEEVKSPLNYTKVEQLPNVKISSPNPAGIEQNKTELNLNKKPSLYGGVLVNASGVAPEIGIQYPVLQKQTNRGIHQFNVGLSAQLNLNTNGIRNSEGTSLSSIQATPSFYANVGYEKIKSNGRPNWGAKVGYQINESSDSSLWQGRSIKASVHKSINDHIKIGPQIIISDDFKKIYPGLALIVS